MTHVLPTGEPDQHDTHPDRRCPCRVRFDLDLVDGRLCWRFIHRPLT